MRFGICFTLLSALQAAWALKVRVAGQECMYTRVENVGDKIFGSFVTHRKEHQHTSPVIDLMVRDPDRGEIAAAERAHVLYPPLKIYEPDGVEIYQLDKRDDYRFEFDAKKTGSYK